MPKLRINKSKERSLTLFYRGEVYRSLLKTIEPVFIKADHTPPDTLKKLVPHILKPDHLDESLKDLYLIVCSGFHDDMVSQIRSKKADTKSIYVRYAADRSKKITGQILSTQSENINNTIDRIVDRMTSDGAGIDKIMREMRGELESELVDIEGWEARRIAQTEVVGSANRGSFDGAVSEGIDGMLKQWLTSGNANVRDTHSEYEAAGPQAMDYEYAPGLKFPGDPDCSDPGEIINCHCTIVYEFEN